MSTIVAAGQNRENHPFHRRHVVAAGAEIGGQGDDGMQIRVE